MKNMSHLAPSSSSDVLKIQQKLNTSIIKACLQLGLQVAGFVWGPSEVAQKWRTAWLPAFAVRCCTETRSS